MNYFVFFRFFETEGTLWNSFPVLQSESQVGDFFPMCNWITCYLKLITSYYLSQSWSPTIIYPELITTELITKYYLSREQLAPLGSQVLFHFHSEFPAITLYFITLKGVTNGYNYLTRSEGNVPFFHFCFHIETWLILNKLLYR